MKNFSFFKQTYENTSDGPMKRLLLDIVGYGKTNS